MRRVSSLLDHTSSIDTTCTIWDLEKEVVDTQLIAHDREVYDFAWGGAGVFWEGGDLPSNRFSHL